MVLYNLRTARGQGFLFGGGGGGGLVGWGGEKKF